MESHRVTVRKKHIVVDIIFVVARLLMYQEIVWYHVRILVELMGPSLESHLLGGPVQNHV